MGYVPILLCVMFAVTATAQNNLQVKGIIKDKNGETIIGANVQEKGTTNGTITDFNGEFQLNVSSNATLVVSFIGYKTEEVAVNGKSTLTITLKDDTEVLEEVVVVGYGVQKKANLTGSVASVSSKDLQDIPVANATNLLQGRLPWYRYFI